MNVLYPMLCLINHYHPQRKDLTDAIDFSLLKAEGYATIQTTSAYAQLGQEVSYTYNMHMLEPYFLLSHYGFAIPNSPYGNLGLTLRQVRDELGTQ